MLKDRVVTVVDGDVQHGSWGLMPGTTTLRRGWFGLTAFDLAGAVAEVEQLAGSRVHANSPAPASWIDWGSVTLSFRLKAGTTFTAVMTWRAARHLLRAIA